MVKGVNRGWREGLKGLTFGGEGVKGVNIGEGERRL